jgi:hypothetical protein
MQLLVGRAIESQHHVSWDSLDSKAYALESTVLNRMALGMCNKLSWSLERLHQLPIKIRGNPFVSWESLKAKDAMGSKN